MSDDAERIRFCTECGRPLQWQALRCKSCGAKLRPTGPRQAAVLPAPLKAERPEHLGTGDYRLKGDPKELVRIRAAWPAADMGYLAADVGVVEADDDETQEALSAFVLGADRRVALLRVDGGVVRVHAVWRDAQGRFAQAAVGRLPDDVARLVREVPEEQVGARLRLLLAPTAEHFGTLRVDIGRSGQTVQQVAADPAPLERAPRGRKRWWSR